MKEGERVVRDEPTPTDGPGPVTQGHPEDSCSLCGDAAERATVLAVDTGGRSARVETACGVVDVALDLVDLPRRGDALLVHQGFAIAVLPAGDGAGGTRERGGA